MMEYYPTLIEAAVNFRIVSRQLLAQHESKSIYHFVNGQPLFILFTDRTYVIQPEHETIAMARGYKVVKEGGEYYCLFKDQSCK